jgi:hypothetical protein
VAPKRKRQKADPAPAPKLPYVVRKGPWARNLYLGLPACLAFSLVFWQVDLAGWALAAMSLPIALMAFVCLFPRETRFEAGGRVIVQRKLLALVPVWRRSYHVSEFKGIWTGSGETGFVGEPSVSVRTIGLVLSKGGFVPVQADSAGADPSPSIKELGRTLPAITGLPRV